MVRKYPTSSIHRHSASDSVRCLHRWTRQHDVFARSLRLKVFHLHDLRNDRERRPRLPRPSLDILVVEWPEVVVFRILGHSHKILWRLARRWQRRSLELDLGQRFCCLARHFRRPFLWLGLRLFWRWFRGWQRTFSTPVPVGCLRRNSCNIVPPVRFQTKPHEIQFVPETCSANEWASCKRGVAITE